MTKAESASSFFMSLPNMMRTIEKITVSTIAQHIICFLVIRISL